MECLDYVHALRNQLKNIMKHAVSSLIIEKLCIDLFQLLFDYADSECTYDEVRNQNN